MTGATFNLVILLLLGSVAEAWFGPAKFAFLYFGGGVISEFLALIWQPHGAGNSIACFALAGAMTMQSAIDKPSAMRLSLAIAGLLAGSYLLFLRDIHGAAYWTGLLLEAVLLFTLSRRNAGHGDRSKF